MKQTTFDKLKVKDKFMFADDLETVCVKVDRGKFEFVGQGWKHSANKNDKVVLKENNTMNEQKRMNELAGTLSEGISGEKMRWIEFESFVGQLISLGEDYEVFRSPKSSQKALKQIKSLMGKVGL